MSDARDPIWDAMKQQSQAKFSNDKQRFMATAIARDDGGWTKHTQWHWSRDVRGSQLNYWPSRNKFQWKGKVQRGDVYAFINKQQGSQQ